jgi:hypothetical protein
VNRLENFWSVLTPRGKFVFTFFPAILIIVLLSWLFPNTPNYQPVCVTHEQANVLIDNLHAAKKQNEIDRAYRAIEVFNGGMELIDEKTGEVSIQFECINTKEVNK